MTKCKNCEPRCLTSICKLHDGKKQEWLHIEPNKIAVVSMGCPYCGCTRPEPANPQVAEVIGEMILEMEAHD